MMPGPALPPTSHGSNSGGQAASGGDSSSSSDLRPSRVLGHVYLGSKAHARNRDILASLRISHVLNCTPPKSMDPATGVPNYYERDDPGWLTYLRVPVFDTAGEDLLPLLPGAIDFIDNAKFYGNVLVHCNKGVSRSPSVVMAYLMDRLEFTLDEAAEHVRSCRPVAHPNASFLAQLRRFEAALRGSRTAAAAAGAAMETRGGADNGTAAALKAAAAMAGPAMGPFSAALSAAVAPVMDVSPEAGVDGGGSGVERREITHRVIVIDAPKHPDVLYPITIPRHSRLHSSVASAKAPTAQAAAAAASMEDEAKEEGSCSIIVGGGHPSPSSSGLESNIAAMEEGTTDEIDRVSKRPRW